VLFGDAANSEILRHSGLERPERSSLPFRTTPRLLRW
jgi:hypothetical protein